MRDNRSEWAGGRMRRIRAAFLSLIITTTATLSLFHITLAHHHYGDQHGCNPLSSLFIRVARAARTHRGYYTTQLRPTISTSMFTNLYETITPDALGITGLGQLNQQQQKAFSDRYANFRLIPKVDQHTGIVSSVKLKYKLSHPIAGDDASYAADYDLTDFLAAGGDSNTTNPQTQFADVYGNVWEVRDPIGRHGFSMEFNKHKALSLLDVGVGGPPFLQTSFYETQKLFYWSQPSLLPTSKCWGTNPFLVHDSVRCCNMSSFIAELGMEGHTFWTCAPLFDDEGTFGYARAYNLTNYSEGEGGTDSPTTPTTPPPPFDKNYFRSGRRYYDTRQYYQGIDPATGRPKQYTPPVPPLSARGPDGGNRKKKSVIRPAGIRFSYQLAIRPFSEHMVLHQGEMTHYGGADGNQQTHVAAYRIRDGFQRNATIFVSVRSIIERAQASLPAYVKGPTRPISMCFEGDLSGFFDVTRQYFFPNYSISTIFADAVNHPRRGRRIVAIPPLRFRVGWPGEDPAMYGFSTVEESAKTCASQGGGYIIGAVSAMDGYPHDSFNYYKETSDRFLFNNTNFTNSDNFPTNPIAMGLPYAIGYRGDWHYRNLTADEVEYSWMDTDIITDGFACSWDHPDAGIVSLPSGAHRSGSALYSHKLDDNYGYYGGVGDRGDGGYVITNGWGSSRRAVSEEEDDGDTVPTNADTNNTNDDASGDYTRRADNPMRIGLKCNNPTHHANRHTIIIHVSLPPDILRPLFPIVTLAPSRRRRVDETILGIPTTSSTTSPLPPPSKEGFLDLRHNMIRLSVSLWASGEFAAPNVTTRVVGCGFVGGLTTTLPPYPYPEELPPQQSSSSSTLTTTFLSPIIATSASRPIATGRVERFHMYVRGVGLSLAAGGGSSSSLDSHLDKAIGWCIVNALPQGVRSPHKLFPSLHRINVTVIAMRSQRRVKSRQETFLESQRVRSSVSTSSTTSMSPAEATNMALYELAPPINKGVSIHHTVYSAADANDDDGGVTATTTTTTDDAQLYDRHVPNVIKRFDKAYVGFVEQTVGDYADDGNASAVMVGSRSMAAAEVKTRDGGPFAPAAAADEGASGGVSTTPVIPHPPFILPPTQWPQAKLVARRVRTRIVNKVSTSDTSTTTGTVVKTGAAGSGYLGATNSDPSASQTITTTTTNTTTLVITTFTLEDTYAHEWVVDGIVVATVDHSGSLPNDAGTTTGGGATTILLRELTTTDAYDPSLPLASTSMVLGGYSTIDQHPLFYDNGTWRVDVSDTPPIVGIRPPPPPTTIPPSAVPMPTSASSGDDNNGGDDAHMTTTSPISDSSSDDKNDEDDSHASISIVGDKVVHVWDSFVAYFFQPYTPLIATTTTRTHYVAINATITDSGSNAAARRDGEDNDGQGTIVTKYIPITNTSIDIHSATAGKVLWRRVLAFILFVLGLLLVWAALIVCIVGKRKGARARKAMKAAVEINGGINTDGGIPNKNAEDVDEDETGASHDDNPPAPAALASTASKALASANKNNNAAATHSCDTYDNDSYYDDDDYDSDDTATTSIELSIDSTSFGGTETMTSEDAYAYGPRGANNSHRPAKGGIGALYARAGRR